MNLISCKVTIIWIPGHVDIAGNERDDKIAKASLGLEIIQNAIPVKLQDKIKIADEYILTKWQERWDKCMTKTAYKICPKVSYKMKYKDNNRKMEVTITRLRVGMRKLGYYLNKINKNINNLCVKCMTNEDIEHFNLYCNSNGEMLSRLKTESLRLGVVLNLNDVLNNKSLIEIVY